MTQLLASLGPGDGGGFDVPVDRLLLLLVGTSGLVVVGLASVIGFFLVKYRRGSKAERRSAESSTRLEIIWSAIPLVIFLVIFGIGASTYMRMFSPPDDALEVKVAARQWMWEFYRDDGPKELGILHVPVGRPVRLTMISEDVIHSFYVPSMRLKHDVLPGRYVRTWFTPTRTGTYPIYCAEYCGEKHSQMRAELVVMDPDDYSAWLEGHESDRTLAQKGRELYTERGCSGCHEAGGTVRAPSLNGLYGSVVPLQDGRTIIADAGYLRDSILLPKKDVAAGYDPVMPSFEGQLEEREIFALIAYLKSRSDTPR